MFTNLAIVLWLALLALAVTIIALALLAVEHKNTLRENERLEGCLDDVHAEKDMYYELYLDLRGIMDAVDMKANARRFK
jgi:hypothetical protein